MTPTPTFPMPHVCSIQRLSYGGETDYGGETVAESTIAGGLECFVQAARSAEREKFLKSQMDVDVKIYFLTEPPLREGDRVTVTQNKWGSSYVGQQFEFMVIDDATAGAGIAWKAFCKRLSNPVEPVV